jgi:hypothetical protein
VFHLMAEAEVYDEDEERRVLDSRRECWQPSLLPWWNPLLLRGRTRASVDMFRGRTLGGSNGRTQFSRMQTSFEGVERIREKRGGGGGGDEGGCDGVEEDIGM